MALAKSYGWQVVISGYGRKEKWLTLIIDSDVQLMIAVDNCDGL